MLVQNLTVGFENGETLRSCSVQLIVSHPADLLLGSFVFARGPYVQSNPSSCHFPLFFYFVSSIVVPT